MFEEKEVMLGKIKQVIALEGADSGPIMIMFHGGPWGPLIYGHAYRGYYPKLYKNVGLVWWDQYGCGRNHAKHVDENICVKDFARMAVDLVDAVHAMFPERKLILNGNSFGCYLAMTAGAARPDIVSGIICLGPIYNMKEAPVHFEEAAKAQYSTKEKEQVEALRKEGGIKFFLLVGSKLAEKYTNCAHYKGKEAHDGLTIKWLMRLFTSKDCRLSDIAATLKMSATPGKSYDRLWNSLLQIDLSEIYQSIKLPVLLLQGSEELYVLPKELEALAEKSKNITYVKYEHCGHIPTTESFPRMLDQMVEFAKTL